MNAAPFNVLSNMKVPLRELPRNVFLPFNARDAGFLYTTMNGMERPPFLGLDLSIANESGATALISLDGQDFNVLDATIKNFDSFPYVTIQVKSAGSTANQIQLILAGCSYDILKKFAPQAESNIWA